MIDPAYHDIQADQIPEVELENGKVKVISGTFQDITGPGRPHTGMMYLDVHLNDKQDIVLPIEDGWNGFVYVYEGSIDANISVPKGSLAVLNTNNDFRCSSTKENTRFILVAGQPLNEPVARGGPFVMNTKGEILQAFEDYHSGRLG